MSRQRIFRRWQDAYAMRRGVFYFILFFFSMVLFFKLLKIVHEVKHREQFHRTISTNVDYVLSYIQESK